MEKHPTGWKPIGTNALKGECDRMRHDGPQLSSIIIISIQFDPFLSLFRKLDGLDAGAHALFSTAFLLFFSPDKHV